MSEPNAAALVADPAFVHFAVVREGLWSSACSEQRGWVAPLANLWTQVTCPACKAKPADGRKGTGHE